MATTSRRSSRVGERRRASPAPAAKADKSAKPGGDGKTNGGSGAAVEAKAAAGKAGKSDKMVRDTFKMPRREYALIDEVKKRCRALGVDVKKSDVLRAGLVAMAELSDERLGEMLRPLSAARAGRVAGKRAKSPASV